jgi:hypothetical protein
LHADKTVSVEQANTAQTSVQDGVNLIDTYFRELGIDHEFLSMVLVAPAQRMNYLREFDALRLGIFVMDPSSSRLTTPDGFK